VGLAGAADGSTATHRNPEAFSGHDGGHWPAVCRVVASWPHGSFAENLAVDSDGTVYVSLHSHYRIERYDPVTEKLETFAEFPAPVTGWLSRKTGRYGLLVGPSLRLRGTYSVFPTQGFLKSGWRFQTLYFSTAVLGSRIKGHF
jgi:hypothetical protein